jgi:membrane protein
VTSSSRSSLAPEPLPRPVRAVLVRLRDQIFEIDDATLTWPVRRVYFTARLMWLTVRAFFRDQLQMRAASLAFSTLLAIVPALALAFAAARQTGLYETFREGTIDPFLEDVLGREGGGEGVEMLRSSAEAVLRLVERTDLAGLGVSGLLVLVLALLRVLLGVEEAFRHVFEVKGPRRILWRRLRAFLLVSTVAPMGLVYASASASFTHGTWLSRLLEEWVPFAMGRTALLFVLPPLLVLLALYVVYVEVPETRVSRRSALFGAAWAAIFWYGTQLLHVRFQVGLARWNAIYSGFGAFPVLLASIHISWVVVLIGAQLVAAHQKAPSLRVLARGAPKDHASLQALAMRVGLSLARAEGPLDLVALAREAKGEPASVRFVVEALAAHGIVSALGRKRASARPDASIPDSLGEAAGYVLAVDPRELRTFAILEAVERGGGSAELPWHDEDPHIRDLLLARRSAAASSAENLTLAALAERKGTERS